MKALVLLSAGRHPVSGKPGPTRAELQAARMAAALDPDAGALHAGPDAEPLREALGRGLTCLNHLRQDGDPVPALAAALRELKPDIVFAGPRGEGGEDTGLTPYALAHALDWPLVAQAIAVTPGEGGFLVTQALPQGARRRIFARAPLLVTTHPGAPAPLPFAHARARAGRVATMSGAPTAPPAPLAGETRPYRPRPKAMGAAGAAQGGGRVIVNPNPQDAAREILTFLRRLGLASPPE